MTSAWISNLADQTGFSRGVIAVIGGWRVAVDRWPMLGKAIGGPSFAVSPAEVHRFSSPLPWSFPVHPSLFESTGKSSILSEEPPSPERTVGANGSFGFAVEYMHPHLWLWRRVIGLSFGFLLAMLTWLLIKLPTGLVSDETLPTPVQVSAAFHRLRVERFAEGTLWEHAGASLSRLFIGFIFSLLIGYLAGVGSEALPLIRTVADPWTMWFATIPAVVVAPLAIRWLGSAERGVALVVVVIGASVMAHRIVEYRSVPPGERSSALALWQLQPIGLLDVCRNAFLVCWSAVLALETLALSPGLGPMIWSAQSRVDIMMVGVFTAGSIGFVGDAGFRTLRYFVVLRRDQGAQRSEM